MDDEKEIIHAKRWGVYMNNKRLLIKGRYSMEVSGSDGKKVVWEVVDNHVVRDPKVNDKIGLRVLF